MGKNGQSSLEFLYSAGFTLALLTSIAAVYFYTTSDAQGLGEYASARRVCTETASIFSAVYSGGDGMSAQYEMPAEAALGGYNITVAGAHRSIIVGFGKNAVFCSFIGDRAAYLNESGNATFGINADGTITNRGGVAVYA